MRPIVLNIASVPAEAIYSAGVLSHYFVFGQTENRDVLISDGAPMLVVELPFVSQVPCKATQAVRVYHTLLPSAPSTDAPCPRPILHSPLPVQPTTC